MRLLLWLLFVFLLLPWTLDAKNYLQIDGVQSFIDRMVTKHKFQREDLEKLFEDVIYQQTALAFYNEKIKPLPEKTGNIPKKSRFYKVFGGSWDKYSHNILKYESVLKGKAYMAKHKETLLKAEKKYGIPAEYITAIIGIESYYGKNVGKYPVFDTLTTLAFEPNRRNDFFKNELEAFLVLAKNENRNPKEYLGSYAGAIGLGQFMPSNFNKLARDFNADGKIDLNNHIDAIGSIANYLHKSGWKRLQEVAIPGSFFGNRYTQSKTGCEKCYKPQELKQVKASRPTSYKGDVYLIKLDRSDRDEIWLGTNNFYAITRYNHSEYYAMAVHQLAQKLMGRTVGTANNSEKNIYGDTIIESEDLNHFLDAPMKKRKFIIDL